MITTRAFLIFLVLIIYSLQGCQTIVEEMHPFCASSFCSIDGKIEIQELIKMPISEQELIIPIQLIYASNQKNLGKKYLTIENFLNTTFKEVNIKFKVNKEIIDLKNDNNIDKIYDNQNLKHQILDKYNSPNVINLYIVPTGKNLNGYTDVLTEAFDTYSTSGYNYMFISEKAVLNGSTIQHELGHFFGLQHTFGESPMEGATMEKPDGSNCTEEGDFICDTPSDPNGKIDKNCNFVGLANGGKYPVVPDIGNFMSYYPSSCKNHYTAMQKRLIYNFALNFKSYLIENYKYKFKMKYCLVAYNS